MAGRLHHVGGVLQPISPRGVCGWPQIRRGAVWLACQFGVAGVATRLCLTYLLVDEDGLSIDDKLYEYSGDHSSFCEGIDVDYLIEIGGA